MRPSADRSDPDQVRAELRAELDHRYRQLVAKILVHPDVIEAMSDHIKVGVKAPFEAISGMEHPEVQLLFLLGHVALTEGLLRASGPEQGRAT